LTWLVAAHINNSVAELKYLSVRVEAIAEVEGKMLDSNHSGEVMIALLYTSCGQKYIVLIVCDRKNQHVVQHFFFRISHAFGWVTAVTHDSLVWNSGFEAQIIADLRAILGVLPGQRYRGASGGLRLLVRQ